jgi:type VI secretion system protein ImpA
MGFVLPIDDLLVQISEQNPCGQLENSYAGQLDALLAAVRSKPAETIIRDGAKVELRPAEEPDWPLLCSVSEALFRGTEAKDLTVGNSKKVQFKPFKHLCPAMVLTLAALRTEGLAGFVDGLELVSRLLDQYWPSLHPLPVDDPDEPFYKRGILLAPLTQDYNELKDSWRFIERVATATLIESSAAGPLTVGDCVAPWAAGLGLKLPENKRLTEGGLRAALLEPAGRQKAQQMLTAAVQAAKRIGEAFTKNKATGAPSLNGLLTLLETAEGVLAGKPPFDGGGTKRGGSTEEGGTREGGNRVATEPGSHSGPIATREEACACLDEIANFFRKNERSSPIPFLLERVKRIMDQKDFLGVLEEMKEELGKESVPGFKKLAGVREAPPQS